MDKWTSSSRLTSSLFLILQLGPLMIWRSTCFRSLFFSSSLRSLQGYSISARQFEASKFKVSHNALSVVDRSVGGESAPSRLPNSLTKSEKNAISVDKVNAGIRLIQHGSEIMLLWKTSNVALNPGESLFRPASLPVADWITSQFPRCNFSIMFQHLLSSDISGIVVVAKSDYNPDQLPGKSALSCITFTYEAVIYEEKLPLESTVSTDSLPVEPAEHIKTISDRLEGLKHSISQDLNRGVGLKNTVNQMNFAVVQSARSGSYGTLNLVNITFSGSDYPSLITPSFILDSLSSAGLSCVREGKRPYLSLVGMEIAGEREKEKGLTVREATPSKFLKLIRREEILFNRLNQQDTLSATPVYDDSTSPDSTPSTSGLPVIDKSASKQCVLFDGLRIEISDSALQPRNSSAVLVHLAVEEIARMRGLEDATAGLSVAGATGVERRRSYRVLDLGCGSGALLLATLARLGSRSICAIGVGVDLDEEALRAAGRNAEVNSQTACEWITANFGELHLESVRSLLIDAARQCTGRDESCRGLQDLDRDGEGEEEGDGLFDVILCNPPFLSDRAARGRVTAEGKRVLVGGLQGMEPYIAICKSINADSNSCRAHSTQQRDLGVSVIGDKTTSTSTTSSSGSSGPKGTLFKRMASAASRRAAVSDRTQEITGSRMSLLSALPLLSPKGVLVFQVPGGERGWSDVSSAVRQVGGFTTAAVEDERGVKRCLVLRRKEGEGE